MRSTPVSSIHPDIIMNTSQRNEATRTSGDFTPSIVGAIAIYTAFVAIMLQTLVRVTSQDSIPWYLGLFAAYLILFSLTLWRPYQNTLLLYVYLCIQSAVIFALLSLNPSSDVVTGLFALLSYQIARFFTGRDRWLWLSLIIVGIIGSLMFYHGGIWSLAHGMTPAGAGIALAFLVIANQEAAEARRESEAIFKQLERSHAQLQAYADQVEHLAALEERNRLARELHDTVSQTIFSISLTTRSTQILLKQNPDQVRSHLEEIQALTSSALAELRSMVARLRPDPG
jgi:signal transduction histidine kinase